MAAGDFDRGIQVSYNIHWRRMFRVKDRPKAEGRIRATRALFGRPVDVLECETYWKIPELWVCRLQMPARPGPVEQIVLDALVLADRLGNGWLVLGPSIENGELT